MSQVWLGGGSGGSGPTSDFHASPFIVSPNGATDGAQYTTIAAAYAAAPANGVIILQAGTYTENLVLTKTVHFTALYDQRSGSGQAVVWHGKISDGGVARSCSFYGITFTPNSDYSFEATAGTDFNISSCSISATSHTPFHLTNGSANLFLYNCDVIIQTTGIAFADQTNGDIWVYDTDVTNPGASTTTGTFSGGFVTCYNANFDMPLSSTGGQFRASRSTLDTSDINTAFLTTAISGTSSIEHCTINSGSASALVIGVLTTVDVILCDINSSNTNALTGVGTLNYGTINYTGSSSTNDVIFQNAYVVVPGGILTIDGDNSTSVTGSVVKIYASPQAGSSVSFLPTSATDLALNMTDSINNTIIGSLAGNASITGHFNSGIGRSVFNLLSSGGNNIALGFNSLSKLTSGAVNLAIGNAAGSSYTSSESSNICLGHLGVAAESHVMRLGTTGSSNGQVNKAFIAGINGVTVSNQLMVVMNSFTEQLGTTTFTTGGTFTPALQFGGASTGITYGTQSGTYSRIGNVVTFCIHIILTSKGSSTGAATITGLPFSAATTTSLAMSCDTLTLTGSPNGLLVSNSISLNQITAGTLANLSDINFANTSTIDISASYLV